METNDEIIYKYHGINNCLHTNAGENGLAMRDDGSIKCYDCGRVFDCLSDLTKDTAAEAIKLARASTAKQIFAELEAIKDEYNNPLLDTLFGKGVQYAKVKMKYTNKSVLCKNCHKQIYYSDSTWYHLDDGNGQCETPITYAEPDEKKEVD